MTHMYPFSIRGAAASDAAFLEDMLVEAANAPEGARSRQETLADPNIARYIDGWPRATDMGIVATVGPGTPIGAAWLRYFTEAEHAYGFVQADIPELAIGVVSDQRGRGVGRALLRALRVTALNNEVVGISLSVERANPAWWLYNDEGYRVTNSREHADTMLLKLDQHCRRSERCPSDEPR